MLPPPRVAKSLEEMQPCELCGHVFGQRHRIKPGCWGGEYTPGNVVWLCPNHHAAIHLFVRWYYRGIKEGEEEARLMEHLTDRPLKQFWVRYVKPVVIERLMDEGRYYPYRQIVPEAEVSRKVP